MRLGSRVRVVSSMRHSYVGYVSRVDDVNDTFTLKNVFVTFGAEPSTCFYPEKTFPSGQYTSVEVFWEPKERQGQGANIICVPNSQVNYSRDNEIVTISSDEECIGAPETSGNNDKMTNNMSRSEHAEVITLSSDNEDDSGLVPAQSTLKCDQSGQSSDICMKNVFSGESVTATEMSGKSGDIATGDKKNEIFYVVAPIDGLVTTLSVNTGSWVHKGDEVIVLSNATTSSSNYSYICGQVIVCNVKFASRVREGEEMMLVKATTCSGIHMDNDGSREYREMITDYSQHFVEERLFPNLVEGFDHEQGNASKEGEEEK